MAYQLERLPVSLAGIVAARSRGDECYVGLKDTYMISRCEQGRVKFWTHGQIWNGGVGDLVLHQPGDVHRDLERDGIVTYQILRLPPSLVAGVVADEVRAQAVLPAGDPRGLTFHRLHDAIAANADRFTLECVLAEAVGSLSRITSRFSHTRPVRRALALIQERLAEELSLDDLAAHAKLDKFHLCRAFRDQVGMPPHAYLTQLRIMHAKALLAAGTKPKDVAPRVGLYDQSQLNRHFRRIVGMTPGHFAKNHQGVSLSSR